MSEILRGASSRFKMGAGVGYRQALCLLLPLAFGLRLVMLDRFRFHQDEALYSYWALHFLHEDPYFLTQWIDKPPLFIWLLGCWFHLVGASEASARLLNIGISALAIPVVAAIARQAWSAVAGLAAAAALALNPFAISYSPTAFTDPLFALGGLCSLYAARRGRAFWAGLWLGAAIMTKQQGVLFVPLTLPVLVAAKINATNARPPASDILRLGGGVALIALPILYWDSLRWAVAPSPWDLGLRNYSALALLPFAQWPARAARIADLLWHLTANNIIWLVLAAALVFLALRSTFSVFGNDPTPRRAPAAEKRNAKNGTVFALLLCGWIGAYGGIHAAASLPLWDRYFLPIAPAFAILTGWLAARLVESAPSTRTRACAATLGKRAALGVWIALLLPGAAQAARGAFPLGGDHGAYDGLREALVWLDRHSPARGILYHQTLSWHLQFYLYQNPCERGATPASVVVACAPDRTARVAFPEPRWFASPVSLADDAAKMRGRPKFVLVPAWLPPRNFQPHLAARELELIQRHAVKQFTVYELASRRRSGRGP